MVPFLPSEPELSSPWPPLAPLAGISNSLHRFRSLNRAKAPTHPLTLARHLEPWLGVQDHCASPQLHIQQGLLQEG